jgi:hypothetical protein
MSERANDDLRQLRSTLLSWRAMANSSEALIGLGEAIEIIDAFDELSEDDEDGSDKTVTLTFGLSVVGDDCREGVYASITVARVGILLDDLRTQYSAEYGSDHFSTIGLRFEPLSSFQFDDIREWLNLVDDLSSDHRTVLKAERDHL